MADKTVDLKPFIPPGGNPHAPHTRVLIFQARGDSLTWICDESFRVERIVPSNPFGGLQTPVDAKLVDDLYQVSSGPVSDKTPGRKEYKMHFSADGGRKQIDPHFIVDGGP